MKKIFAIILISAIALMSSTAVAQQPNRNRQCSSDASAIKQSDPLILICKMPVKARDIATVSHEFNLYKFNPDLTVKTIFKFTIFNDNTRLVTFGEMGSKKNIQFFVRDRKFSQWAKPENIDEGMVNKYRKEIGTLLDAAEISIKSFEQF